MTQPWMKGRMSPWMEGRMNNLLETLQECLTLDQLDALFGMIMVQQCSVVFTHRLHDLWQSMGGTLDNMPEPPDEDEEPVKLEEAE